MAPGFEADCVDTTLNLSAKLGPSVPIAAPAFSLMFAELECPLDMDIIELVSTLDFLFALFSSAKRVLNSKLLDFAKRKVFHVYLASMTA